MKNYVIAIEPEHSEEIQKRLKKEKKHTGKNIRRIVTDILLSEKIFAYQKNKESKDYNKI